MTSEDLAKFRHFMNETMANGRAITTMGHVADDVKSTVRDFIIVCENVTKLLDSSNSQNADARILKKKLDQSKSEFYAVEKKFEKAQSLILSILEDIQDISAANEIIVKNNKNLPASPAYLEGTKIQNFLLKLSDKIMNFNL